MRRLPSTGSRRKYGNKPIVIDGISFDSKREAKRYGELRMLERAKIISDLRTQVKYELDVNGVRISTYTADFVYRSDAGAIVVEDAKGYPNDRWPMKKKLMKAIHGIDIKEV